jgi:hypothetical protein
MPHLVSIEFSSDGPFGADAAAAYAELAADIAAEDGLIWKVWTEDPQTSTAGGAYLFADAESAERYIDKHTRRLGSFGITDARISNLGVNEELSTTTFATLQRD